MTISLFLLDNILANLSDLEHLSLAPQIVVLPLAAVLLEPAGTATQLDEMKIADTVAVDLVSGTGIDKHTAVFVAVTVADIEPVVDSSVYFAVVPVDTYKAVVFVGISAYVADIERIAAAGIAAVETAAVAAGCMHSIDLLFSDLK